MECVTAVGIAAYIGQGTGSILFQHHEGGAFTQVQSGAGVVERTASFPVQDHKGIESVQVVAAQRLRTAGDDQVHLVVLQHLGAQHNGVQGR